LQITTPWIYSKGNIRNFCRNWDGVGKKWLSAYKSSNISDRWKDSNKVTIEVQQEVTYMLSIGAKVNDLV